jgi:hypothetical protein
MFVVAVTATTLKAQGTLIQIDDAGGAVASAGDVDGDGRADVLAARSAAQSSIGRVRLVSSATGATLATVDGPFADDGFGSALAGARDLDGDGKPDFVVGAPNAESTLGVLPAVRAYTANGALLWSASGLFGSRFGAAVALGGDLDGDGVGDVLVGAPDDGASTAGAVHVLSGASGTALRSHASAGPNDGELGFAVAFVGDVDGDGVDDYAFGDPHTSVAATGKVELVSGATGASIRTWVAPSAGQFGCALALAGDVDGDGVGELVVGAMGEPVAPFTTGVVRLYSGANGALISTTPAEQQGLMLGRSVTGLGDYDGDGIEDYAAELPAKYIGGAVKNFGGARVISGANGLVIAQLGFGSTGAIAGVGDVNLDGVADLVVGGNPAPSAFAALVLGHASVPTVYCTAKQNSLGCTPTTSFYGASSASIGPDFTVLAANVQGGKPGLCFWSLGAASTPFGGGFLCVGAPIHRTTVTASGGSSLACDGVLAHTFTKGYLAVQIGRAHV